MLYYYKVKKKRRFKAKELLAIAFMSTLVWAYFYPGSFANIMPELEKPSLPSLPSSLLSSSTAPDESHIEQEKVDPQPTISLNDARQVKEELKKEGKKREASELKYSLDLVDSIDRSNPAAETRVKMIMQDIEKTITYFAAGNTASDKMAILKDYDGGNLAYVYYPNYGVHFNPVTTANMGIEHYGKGNHEKVVKITDELIAHAIEREYPDVGSYYIWENYFDLEFGAQKFEAPWTSGMAQGLILDLIGKSYEITKDKKYLLAGEKVLNSFRVPWSEGGVTDYDEHGNWYLEVAATNKLRILNGFLFTLDSLHNYYKQTGNTKAQKLFYVGASEAKAHIQDYDLGYWSNYSLVEGNKASFEYHKIHTTLLYRLYDTTEEPVFKEYGDKFNYYLKYHFIDIPKEHRSYEKITALTKGGVIVNENGWFGPHDVMTKADFIVWLCRVKNWSPNAVFHGYYRDIGRDRTYWGYIETLKERGIDLGDKDGLIWPDKEVTRGEAAAILCAVYETPLSGNPLMKDISGDHPYYKEINIAVSNNLMGVYEPNYFRPDLKLTREQAASLFYELIGR